MSGANCAHPSLGGTEAGEGGGGGKQVSNGHTYHPSLEVPLATLGFQDLIGGGVSVPNSLPFLQAQLLRSGTFCWPWVPSRFEHTLITASFLGAQVFMPVWVFIWGVPRSP